MTRSALTISTLATCLLGAASAIAETHEAAVVAATTELPTAPVDTLGLPSDIVIAPRATAARAGRTSRTPKRVRSADTGLDRGATFELDRLDRGDRNSASPRVDSELRMTGVTVSAAAVGVVIREHMGELEYCMTRLPKGARDGAVGLALTIEPRGNVSAARLVGGPQAPAFTQCVVGQARRWSFPAGDVTTELEYPIMLNGQR